MRMDDIQIRSFAGAFLRYKAEVLLMKRGLHKRLSPGLWAGIGGHIEPYDNNSPLTACVREIEEETGILSAQIEQLNLRYFALVNDYDFLSSIYYFSGVLKEKPFLRQTEEGELYWVKLEEGIEKPMAQHVKSFYLHWVNNLQDDSLHCLFIPPLTPL